MTLKWFLENTNVIIIKKIKYFIIKKYNFYLLNESNFQTTKHR